VIEGECQKSAHCCDQMSQKCDSINQECEGHPAIQYIYSE
jgi:hypothetical protein